MTEGEWRACCSPSTHFCAFVLGFQELPYNTRDPSAGPPSAPVEFDMAAAGRFGGYYLDPGWTRHFGEWLFGCLSFTRARGVGLAEFRTKT